MRHCSMGEAEAALEAVEVGLIHWNPFIGVIGSAGLGVWYDCQYRLWATENLLTGANWMFCEEEYFLGATAGGLSYQADPFCDQSFESCGDDSDCPISGEICVDTLREASARLELAHSHVKFGPEDGSLEEREMKRTPVKVVHDRDSGNLAWIQSGFIERRPPGIYRSEHQAFFDGELESEEIVFIEIVSHEAHEARVAEGVWKTQGYFE